jgi:hypothetical protein
MKSNVPTPRNRRNISESTEVGQSQGLAGLVEPSGSRLTPVRTFDLKGLAQPTARYRVHPEPSAHT